jgi:hypothetical protein
MPDESGQSPLSSTIYIMMHGKKKKKIKIAILFPNITSRLIGGGARRDVSENTKCKIPSDISENTEFTFCFCFG